MADVSILDVSAGSYDSLTTSTIVASAATGTIPCGSGKDTRLAVWVKNGDTAAIKLVVKAPSSGGGVRSSLGDMAVTVASGDEALIPLYDTARFKAMASGNIGYALTDTSDVALGATPLGNVTLVAVQL